MSSVVDWLVSIAESIISLPVTIFEGIKSIFIPDTEAIKENFNTTLNNIQDILNLPVDSIEDAFNSVSEQPVQDIVGNYKLHGVGTLRLKFFDTEFFRQGIQYFRPLVRGFIVLLLFFYNYKQLLTFLGQDPSIAHNARDNANEHIKRGGGKE